MRLSLLWRSLLCWLLLAGLALAQQGGPGFTAANPGTPLTATTGGATATLPPGQSVVATNLGSVTAYCQPGAAASTSSQPIAGGSGFQFQILPGTTQITCVTGSSTATINLVGGTGLGVMGGGGGSGGGGGGNVTVVAPLGSQTGSNSVAVICNSGCSGGPADESTFTPGTTPIVTGGFYQTTATSNPLTNGQAGSAQMTADRALHINLRNSSGAELGVAAAPLQVSLANTASNATAVLVTGTGGTFPSTNALSGSTTLQNAATGNGNGTSMSVAGYGGAVLHVVCSVACSGTQITFYASFDNSNFFDIEGTQVGGGPPVISTATTGDFTFNVAGYSYLRAAISSYSAGTITVTGYATSQPSLQPEYASAIAHWGGLTLGQPSNYGTSPGAVLVPGVNANVTNTVAAALNATPSLANGNGVVPTQGGTVLSATNGGYQNVLQGNAVLSVTNGLPVQQVSPYPLSATPITASATGTTGATTATLAATSGKTTYICTMSIRANATAAATGNATVTGTITGTLNYTQWTAPLASGLGVTEELFTPCVPASGTNQTIAVVSAAPGSGGTVSVSASGYQQ
jgi:fibronectin-binding autotransporter adhesin